MKKINLILFTVSVLILVAAPIQLQAQDLSNREYDFGVTAAYWMDGNIVIQGTDFDKDSAFLLRAFGDFYVVPKFAMGFFFNYSPYTQSGTDVNFYEFGGAFKLKFLLQKDLALKPGINIGYRFTSADVEVAEIDALGVNLSIELQKALDNMMIFGEFGFLSQPSGGNSDVEVTFAPIIYIGGGIAF